MYRIVAFLNRKDYSLSEYLFLNYYWILTFGGIIAIFANVGWFSGLLIPLLIYVLWFKSARKPVLSYSVLDILWLFSFIWSILTWLFNSYPNQGILISYCFSEQLSYMFIYWVVRKNQKINVDTIIRTSYVPFIITCVLGIYLYYAEPAWYVAKTADYSTDFEEWEFKRLRSILDGYTIAYYIAIVIIFEFFLYAKNVIDSKSYFNIKVLSNRNLHFIMLLIASFALFLGIQRSAIVSIALGFCIAVYYSFKYTKLANLSKMYVLIAFSIVTCIFSIAHMSDAQKLFYLNKVDSFTQSGSDLAKERLVLNKHKRTYEFMGDGVGRHNMYADKFNPRTSMRDGEYMKILTEQGYGGAFILALIAFYSLAKCFKNFRYLSFELSIMLMLLISMIGANPISTFDKHPIIYWMVLAQIANFKKNNKYATNFNNNRYL